METGGEEVEKHLPFASSLPEHTQQPGTGQAEVLSWNSSLISTQVTGV